MASDKFREDLSDLFRSVLLEQATERDFRQKFVEIINTHLRKPIMGELSDELLTILESPNLNSELKNFNAAVGFIKAMSIVSKKLNIWQRNLLIG